MIALFGGSPLRSNRGLGFVLALVFLPATLGAATVPAGFTDEVLTSALASPTAMALAPDGRFFVAEQGGALRVVAGGALLATPFVRLDVDSDGERGLLGVAVDPGFPAKPYVYLYYTVPSSPRHNRISRFRAQGNMAEPGSETVLFELDNLSGATNHNGGAIHFGPDGKLYVGVGENANGANSQSLQTVLGKLLRLNADGSIPADNPFFGSTGGKNRAIWALGLRNPFTFAFSSTGRLFIDDVGQSAWEEIDDGIAGSNYGWPNTEGPTSNPAYRGPLFAYSHDDGCAITGGAFYTPASPTFPDASVGKYFFSDLCGGWIHRFDPASREVNEFAAGIDQPVDLVVSPQGDLFYLAHSGTLGRIRAAPSGEPSIDTPPHDVTVTAPAAAHFSVVASGEEPLAYQWRRDGAPIPGATASTYALTPTELADDGARFDVVVTNALGSATSTTAMLHVQAPPPAAGEGLGLVGSYYGNKTLSGPARNRLDKQVSFDWGYGQPFPGIGADLFSVRWSGQVLSRAGGVYTFTANSDDGVRLWVNGRPLIDDWNDHSPLENSASITLAAGTLYDIRLEFYEDFGTAVVQLFWSGPGFAKQIVPQASLYPYALVLTGEPPATAADLAVRERLQNDGFAPLLMRGATAKAGDADGKALLVVSATVDPASVGARFRTSALPLVAWESALFDDLGMTGASAGTSFGTLPGQTRLRIVKPGHPLAAGLTGAVPATTAPSTFSFGEPNAHALVIARQIGDARHPVLFAYDRGATMPGLVAPARRVGLFFGDSTAAALTDKGRALFDAAVAWAIGR
jgi:glucose/arabinose dehydrogenase